jgi:hypothetical protein
MTGTKTTEYQSLARASSSEMLDYDSRWVLGRYEKAASHALRAATARARMAQLCLDAGEYAEAVEDWLSAAGCFLQATARQEAGTVLCILHGLEADGRFPLGRADLNAAFRERERELESLNHKVQQLLRDLQCRRLDVADEQTLHFLLEQVRELPGLALLHSAISQQAAVLGQGELGKTHLAWAKTFDPDLAMPLAQPQAEFLATPAAASRP